MERVKYDPSKPLKYKTPSEKQQRAWARNWALRQLRAYFHLVPPPVGRKTREQIQRLVDREIKKLGGESEILREKRRQEDLE